MNRLFIADLHLEESKPALTDSFQRLIEYWHKSIDALYILGDLFNYWIGDDVQNACSTQVAQTLHSMPFNGWIYGNRDFLLGSTYMQQAKLTPLKSFHKLRIGQHTAILCHGDELCTQDIHHQAQRAKYMQPAFQQKFLSQSIDYRIAYARRLREQSSKRTSTLTQQIMDVDISTVEQTMCVQNAEILIHGHTHRPAIHTHNNKKRLVLGDWQDTHGWYAIETTNTKLNAHKQKSASQCIQLIRFSIPFTPHDQQIVATIDNALSTQATC